MSCDASQIDLCAERNTDFVWNFTLLYRKTRLPIDLTNNTFVMVFKKTKEDESPYLTLTNGNGITVTPLTGQVSVRIPMAQINAIDVNALLYSMTRAYGGNTYPFTFGNLTIEGNIL